MPAPLFLLLNFRKLSVLIDRKIGVFYAFLPPNIDSRERMGGIKERHVVSNL